MGVHAGHRGRSGDRRCARRRLRRAHRGSSALNTSRSSCRSLITLTVRGSLPRGATSRAHDEHGGIAAGSCSCGANRCCAGWRSPGSCSCSAWAWGWWPTRRSPSRSASGAVGFGLLIACWGTGSVAGRGRRPVGCDRATEPVWMVVRRRSGSRSRRSAWASRRCSCSCSSRCSRWAPPTVSRSWPRTASCSAARPTPCGAARWRRSRRCCRSGLAVAYLAAGPVLTHVGPQAIYRIGGVRGAGGRHHAGARCCA